jgi:hypothetical protein
MEANALAFRSSPASELRIASDRRHAGLFLFQLANRHSRPTTPKPGPPARPTLAHWVKGGPLPNQTQPKPTHEHRELKYCERCGSLWLRPSPPEPSAAESADGKGTTCRASPGAAPRPAANPSAEATDGKGTTLVVPSSTGKSRASAPEGNVCPICASRQTATAWIKRTHKSLRSNQ